MIMISEVKSFFINVSFWSAAMSADKKLRNIESESPMDSKSK